MQITCVSCGSEKFRAGDVQPHPEGGFDVVMPCSQCGTPNTIVHDDDPEFAKQLLSFFAVEPA
jgi:uncharacterized Zn finger protein